MKSLHRKDLFGWSVFDNERNLDFHSLLWTRPSGNIVIDPLPLSEHDYRHLQQLGGISVIVITNSDHCRAAESLARTTGAMLYGPAGEREGFKLTCQRWLDDAEEIVHGLISYRMEGSKTPGELALILEDTTLITGDLIRSHIGGELCLLPEAKLTDRQAAIASVKRLAALPNLQSVLPGDGWPIFKHGGEALQKLADTL
jgi:hypothetical protein